MKKPALTQNMLENFAKQLIKDGGASRTVYDKKGRPCYALHVEGTKKQIAKLQKQLDALL